VKCKHCRHAEDLHIMDGCRACNENAHCFEHFPERYDSSLSTRCPGFEKGVPAA